MRTPSSQYSELHADAKHDEGLVNSTGNGSRCGRRAAVWTISMAVLASMLLLGLGTGILKMRTPAKLSPAKDPDAEWSARASRAAGDQYLLGVGKADITGPVVELNFMGYARLGQIGTGLRQRIYSRAFIVGSTTNPIDRWVYLVLDTANGDTAVRNGILEGVAALGSGYAAYGSNNIAVTGTHSHSGPGAWLNYLLPQVTSLGFSTQSYQAIVDGAVLSIKRAHETLAPGSLAYGETNVTNANINRSLYAYLANPADERAKYEYDVDKTITMLRFQRSDGLNLGILAWHAVHGTSMLENNTHVSGDNKGVSSYLFEKSVAPENPNFVAAFSQANVGDTTPNVLGAYCDDGSGEECRFEDSTCEGASQDCHGRGPKFEAVDLGVSSCYEIGRRVFAGAKALYDSFDSVSTPVSDQTVKAYHTFQDMTFFKFSLPNGTTVETCPAALGYGFAGGTSDGPGAFDFKQNDPDTNAQNPFRAIVSGVLSTPTPEQKACHSPKLILLNVGQMFVPYAWSPNTIDVQSFRVGQFIIIVSPTEATTMSGRRWRDAIKAAAISNGITASEPTVVLGGPANSYAHYVATPEEYGIQRYEGASTLYGQHELDAYIHLSISHIGYLASDSTTQPVSSATPPDNREVSTDLSLIEKNIVVYDNPPLGKTFGQCTKQPAAGYALGAVVNATFVGANPRNNLRLEGTFTAVEQSVNGIWTKIRDDADWSLLYTWTRTDGLLGYSQVVVSWETGFDEVVAAGTYRLRYYGDNRLPVLGTIRAFEGASNSFTLS